MLLSPRAQRALLRTGVQVAASAARGKEHGVRHKADLGLNLGVSAFPLDNDLTSLSLRGHARGTGVFSALMSPCYEDGLGHCHP